MIVPDLLRSGLSLVLCGTAPSRASMEAQAYYAHPGNLFWKTLHDIGLTPRRLMPEEYPCLLDYGIGLTDLNKTDWGADADLPPDGFDIPAFIAKIDRYQPAAVAFTSKFAASRYLVRSSMTYGLQPDRRGDTAIFVLPSPSGRARGYFRIEPWREVATFVHSRY